MASRPDRLAATALEAGCGLPASFQPDEGVDVIVARLPEDPRRLLSQTHLLSAGELLRAGKYRRNAHREQFTARRVLLRLWLAGALGVAPNGIQIESTPYGKPFQVQSGSDAPIADFNMSISSGDVALAIHRTGRVGVDVEHDKTKPNMADMLEAICTPEEMRILKTLSPSATKHAFYQVWTAKEAYLKAVGAGLLRDLNSVNIKWGTSKAPLSITKDSLPGWRLGPAVLPCGLHVCVCWEKTISE